MGSKFESPFRFDRARPKWVPANASIIQVHPTTNLAGERIPAFGKREFQCHECAAWFDFGELGRRSRRLGFLCNKCHHKVLVSEKSEYVTNYSIWEAIPSLTVGEKKTIEQAVWSSVKNDIKEHPSITESNLKYVRRDFSKDLFRDVAYRIFPKSLQSSVAAVIRDKKALPPHLRAWLAMRRGVYNWYPSRLSSLYFLIKLARFFDLDMEFIYVCREVVDSGLKSLFWSLLRDFGEGEKKKRVRISHIRGLAVEMKTIAAAHARSAQEQKSWFACARMADAFSKKEPYGTLVEAASGALDLCRAQGLDDEEAIDRIGILCRTIFKYCDTAKTERDEYMEALFLEEKTGIDYVILDIWRRKDRDKYHRENNIRVQDEPLSV